jgi:hypothetical protein
MTNVRECERCGDVPANGPCLCDMTKEERLCYYDKTPRAPAASI